MSKKKLYRRGAILLVIVLAITGINLVGSRPAYAPIDKYFEISKNLDIFGKLYREVNGYYVDEVDPNQFMRVGIDGMLESLDPYTNFISASEIEDYRFMSTGEYGGIGAVISKRDGKVLISEPYEDSPADKAGLRAGDIIIQIDEEKVGDVDAQTLDVRNLLRGQAGSTVDIVVERVGAAAPIAVQVTRDDIKIKNVPFHGMVNKEVGYISLTGFTKGANKEVRDAFTELKTNNPEMKGVILDLRGNPGGLLFEAIDISNLFVKQGAKIVETRGKIEGSHQSYYAEKTPLDTEMPLAVLINRRSASASEIVSGVMQDLDRGVVVGQRSFGKGLVQTTRPLSYNTQLKITTAKYYTPSGRCIQAIDYSHRNDDGSVGKVPDSLRKEFKTTNGRSVFDGGGVTPDLKVEDPDYHTVTRELIRQNMIFDFATEFRSKNEEIGNPRDFKINDKIYNEFVAFTRDRKFTFETKTEKELENLKKMLEEEDYYEDVQKNIEELETQVHAQKSSDLNEFRDEISDFLKSEIVTRYHFRSGEIEVSFDNDPDILEALNVLKDPVKYEKTLSGQ